MHGSVSPIVLAALAAEGESALANLLALVPGAGVPPIALTCDMFATLEAKGLATGYTLPAHSFFARKEIFASAEPGFSGEFAREALVVAQRSLLGRPLVDALEEGLSVLLTSNWRERGCLYWAARLADLPDAGRLSTLVDNRRYRADSPLVMRSLAGALAAYLLEEWGRSDFVDRYASWRPSEQELQKLEPGWQRYLTRLRKTHPRERRHEDAARTLPPFQHGFCHAHEGYQIHNGYISRSSDLALGRLSDIGTNAVSITPFTFMRTPAKPLPLPFSSGSGAENDESVVHSTLAAQALGMAVMLKPHVWLRASWPGEIEMGSEDEWNTFFENYYRWIRHYALIAEMYDIDILCIGVEMGKATVGRESRWVDLIDRLRSVYGGRLTYAANWGEEFEQLSFWDHLDYIGVDFYYPLSSKVDATDEDLLVGARAALDIVDEVSERHDVPAIVTEVGYTSSPAPWTRPYERMRATVPDEDAQARCYEAFFRGLQGRERIVGVYWWKWPSFLEFGGPSHTGFSPNRKKAESVVRDWFMRE